MSTTSIFGDGPEFENMKTVPRPIKAWALVHEDGSFLRYPKPGESCYGQPMIFVVRVDAENYHNTLVYGVGKLYRIVELREVQ